MAVHATSGGSPPPDVLRTVCMGDSMCGLPGELLEGVERVVHLDPADMAESGLSGQLAQAGLGQPECAQPLAALGE